MTDQGEGAEPAQITNHAFEPEDAWWTLCRICGLSEPAHETTTLSPEAKAQRRDGAWCATPRLISAQERRQFRGEL